MTKEEYLKLLYVLDDKYEQERQKLDKEYAISNNPYKVGDVITDRNGSGRICKIYITKECTLPSCKYLCDNLTMQGEINKREPHRWIYQCNVNKE